MIYFHLKLVYKINEDYKIYGKDKYIRTLINKRYDYTIYFPELNVRSIIIRDSTHLKDKGSRDSIIPSIILTELKNYNK